MHIVKTSKPRDVNILRRPATQTRYHFDRSDVGKRVTVTRWNDTGIYEVKVCRGHGAKVDFCVYDIIHLSAAQALSVNWPVYASQLADNHF